MENIVQTVTTVNNAVNGFVWGMPMLIMLVGTGILMTILTRAFQLSRFGYWMKKTIGGIFTNKHITAHTAKEDRSISQFQSLCTALAATIGTGNISGVAAAIATGGPGSVFWMWIVAIFGMMTNYSENVLGIYYRRKNFKGEWSGGAMYYLKDGLGSYKGCKQIGAVLAVLFSAFCLLASFGIGNMSQVNSIAANMTSAFSIPATVTGIVLVIIGALVIVGGLKRIAAVTEKLVPFMAIAYVIGALVIFFANIGHVGAVFTAIFKGAFGLRAVGGGIVGSGVKLALTWGMKRGVFSNEAGLGTAPMAHAAATSASPLVQASIGMLDTFIDTIIVCTMTGFAILVTGQWTSGLTGAAMTSAAFETSLPGIGGIAVTICLTFFAFTTALGWCVYGERCAIYFFGDKAQIPFRIVYCIAIPVGVLTQLDVVWLLADTCNALMAIPNLIAILLLSPVLFKLVKEDESKDSIFKH